MNTVSKIIIRFLFIITITLSCMFLSVVEFPKTTTMIEFFSLIMIFVGILYLTLKNRSENEICEILGLSWIEKKTGINFFEE